MSIGEGLRTPEGDSELLKGSGRNGALVMEANTDTPDASETEGADLMIVDDDAEVRTVVAEFLEDLGYRVVQAGSGKEALNLLAHTSNLRMLITDIRMPEMSGIELADLATQRIGDLKVILISGYFVSQHVQRRCLGKPFRMRDLEAAVRAELGT